VELGDRDVAPAAVWGGEGEERGVRCRGEATEQKVGGVRIRVRGDHGRGEVFVHGNSFGTDRVRSPSLDRSCEPSRALGRSSRLLSANGKVEPRACHRIDIGGTKIAGALVSESGEILRTERRPTPAGDPVAIVDNVVELISSLGAGEQIVAAGVAAAGFVDAAQSVVYYAPNINWRSEPFREHLSELLPGIDITVDKTANAAGWADTASAPGAGPPT